MLLAELVVLAFIVYFLFRIRKERASLSEERASLAKARKEFQLEKDKIIQELAQEQKRLKRHREKIEYKRWFYQRTDRERTLR
jgi:DNA integrity scanning protein DisA with diadenylate cyclase activity